MKLRYKIKRYIKYWGICETRFETLNALKNENWSDNSYCCDERLQDTDGFFKVRVRPYVEPVKWGDTDPCIVTIYRHGRCNTWDDMIENVGTDEDVKDFPCPDHQDGCKCKSERLCKFRKKRNRHLDLESTLIPAAQKKWEYAVAKRKAEWNSIKADVKTRLKSVFEKTKER